ncbi:hypothetical protein BDF20DRAFT_836506 [Mycotypha africana]|uniref:uncharacterized protein n=1 Tax=Mycotypha africana TaxID=64632 RepID=UPI0023013676|nr:uncharacterized protein BDF20DRAFT_836506 [Mycotypha africana]KAI8975071.1 hypothetical protein BDF20DRAFT_836506 [Mycotypha africana]
MAVTYQFSSANSIITNIETDHNGIKLELEGSRTIRRSLGNFFLTDISYQELSIDTSIQKGRTNTLDIVTLLICTTMESVNVRIPSRIIRYLKPKVWRVLFFLPSFFSFIAISDCNIIMANFNLINQAAIDTPSSSEILGSLSGCRNKLLAPISTNFTASVDPTQLEVAIQYLQNIQAVLSIVLPSLLNLSYNNSIRKQEMPVPSIVITLSLPPIDIPTFSFSSVEFPLITFGPFVTSATTKAITTTTVQRPVTTSNPGDDGSEFDCPM